MSLIARSPKNSLSLTTLCSSSLVRRGLGEGRTTLILVLADTNQLFRIELLQGSERLRWKHDRLRDALVGQWLAHHALPDVLSGNPSTHCKEFLTSPGLAEAWGMALLFASRQAQANAITVLAEHQPLALANLLRLRPFEEDHLRNLVIQGLRHSLRGWPPAKSAVLGPTWQIIRRLSTTDAEEVLQVTKVSLSTGTLASHDSEMAMFRQD